MLFFKFSNSNVCSDYKIQIFKLAKPSLQTCLIQFVVYGFKRNIAHHCTILLFTGRLIVTEPCRVCFVLLYSVKSQSVHGSRWQPTKAMLLDMPVHLLGTLFRTVLQCSSHCLLTFGRHLKHFHFSFYLHIERV